jgi:hypothetical protein
MFKSKLSAPISDFKKINYAKLSNKSSIPCPLKEMISFKIVNRATRPMIPGQLNDRTSFKRPTTSIVNRAIQPINKIKKINIKEPTRYYFDDESLPVSQTDIQDKQDFDLFKLLNSGKNVSTQMMLKIGLDEVK